MGIVDLNVYFFSLTRAHDSVGLSGTDSVSLIAKLSAKLSPLAITASNTTLHCIFKQIERRISAIFIFEIISKNHGNPGSCPNNRFNIRRWFVIFFSRLDISAMSGQGLKIHYGCKILMLAQGPTFKL